MTLIPVVTGPSAPPAPLVPQLVTQDTPGVPGKAETGDAFGSAFSGTGFPYSGLAIGAPGEAVGKALGAGDVLVLPADANLQLNPGLVPGPREYVQGRNGLPGKAEANDRFGAALLGDRGLLVGAPGEGIGSVPRAGLITFVATTGVGSQISQATGGVPGVPERDDAFGTALASARRGQADAVYVGAPGDAALLALNRADGLSTVSEPGAIIAAQAEAGTGLGTALVTGDFLCGSRSRSDVAVGGPGGAGRVDVLFRGTGTSFVPRGTETITQGSPGVPGAPEARDLFGGAL